jgi:hypothetical protein
MEEKQARSLKLDKLAYLQSKTQADQLRSTTAPKPVQEYDSAPRPPLFPLDQGKWIPQDTRKAICPGGLRVFERGARTG